VHDCKQQVAGYFNDASRASRPADRLEEDLVHHASTLSRCNATNTALKAFDYASNSYLQLSMVSIAGSADVFSSI